MKDFASPPGNSEAEQAAVAHILVGGRESAEAAVRDLRPDDFGDLAACEAFKLAADLLDAGQPVDEVSFRLAWPKRQGTELPAWLLPALDRVASPANLPRLVAEVREGARRRRAWAAAYDLMRAAHDHNAPIDPAAALAAIEGAGTGGAEVLDGRQAGELFVSDIEHRHNLKGERSGITTGFYDLDAMTDGLQAGELSIIAARPSEGKTAIGLNIVQRAALVDRVPVLVVSLEMSVPAMVRRLAAGATGIPLGRLKSGRLTESDFHRLARFNADLAGAPVFWVDGIAGLDLGQIAGAVREAHRTHGIRLVLVDYLQRVRPVERHEKRTYEVAAISAGLKSIAHRHNLALLALAQLNREPDKDGKGRPPRLSDLADSAQIERDADLVALLTRRKCEDNPDGRNATLAVAKQRDGEIGIVRLYFNGATCRFENPAPATVAEEAA